jgi:ribosomal protein S18 acetylase RimI-like enzyme
MSGILTDLSEPALVRACKNNLYRFFETLRAWDEAEIFDDSQLQCWWTPLPHPWFNGVLSRNTLPGDATELIAETKAYFKDKDRQVITWWLAPELEESDWVKQLELNGLGFTNDPPGMAADLSKLNEDLRVPDGLEITKVEDAWEMKTWSEVFTTGYGLPPDWEPINRDMMLAIEMGWPCLCYTASVNGVPAATSAVFYGEGVAGIYCVATLPEWRGRGLGAAVSLAPLLEARQEGYKVVVLQSSVMGYKVYRRLGFREVCRMAHYAYTAYKIIFSGLGF